MLYPLSYEGGGSVSAGHTIREALGGRAACPIPALGVPNRSVSTASCTVCRARVALAWLLVSASRICTKVA